MFAMHTHRISHETSASSAEYIRYFEEHLGPKKKTLVTIDLQCMSKINRETFFKHEG